MFCSKRYALHLLAGNDSATVGTVLSTWEGAGKLSQIQLDLGMGFCWYELSWWLISKVMSHVLATWSNGQYVDAGKPYMSPNHSSGFFGEICIRVSEICQV